MADRYTQRSGIEVDESRVEYYLVLEQLKAIITGLTGLNAFAQGRTSDLRLVQIGQVAHDLIGPLGAQIGLGK